MHEVFSGIVLTVVLARCPMCVTQQTGQTNPNTTQIATITSSDDHLLTTQETNTTGNTTIVSSLIPSDGQAVSIKATTEIASLIKSDDPVTTQVVTSTTTQVVVVTTQVNDFSSTSDGEEDGHIGKKREHTKFKVAKWGGHSEKKLHGEILQKKICWSSPNC